MAHVAETVDHIEVATWTGNVPRDGEVVHVNPARPDAACGRWRVAVVDWAISSGIEADSRAEVTVSPDDDSARAWLTRERADMAQEGA